MYRSYSNTEASTQHSRDGWRRWGRGGCVAAPGAVGRGRGEGHRAVKSLCSPNSAIGCRYRSLSSPPPVLELFGAGLLF